MKAKDRVVLVCAPWSGVVTKVRKDGRLDVALDGGGRAMGMSRDDVRPEEPDEDEEEAEADQSWPPRDMETKVPRRGEGK